MNVLIQEITHYASSDTQITICHEADALKGKINKSRTDQGKEAELYLLHVSLK